MCLYCPHHATTKWVLAHKHKDGCTLDTDWKFPTKQDDAKAKDKKQLQYTNAMVGIASKQGYSSDEEEDENIWRVRSSTRDVLEKQMIIYLILNYM